MKLIYLHDLEIGRLICSVVNKLKASVSVSGGVCALVEDVWLAERLELLSVVSTSKLTLYHNISDLFAENTAVHKLYFSYLI